VRWFESRTGVFFGRRVSSVEELPHMPI